MKKTIKIKHKKQNISKIDNKKIKKYKQKNSITLKIFNYKNKHKNLELLIKNTKNKIMPGGCIYD